MPTELMIRRAVLAAACLLLLLSGCGRRADTDLAPVSGKVCYQGQPLRTGTIIFSPDSTRGTSGELARGDIQPDGTYHLKSGSSLGVTPGSHRVTVIAVEEAPGGLSPHSLLPLKYRDPEMSGLTCEVAPGRENTINFNLQ